MDVTLIKEDGDGKVEIPEPTNEDMENEYRYILAQQLTGRLLEKGLISMSEYEEIGKENQESFRPLVSRIIH
jgi:hypothetical protein